MQKKLTIGLFGFGVVGEGIYQVVKNTAALHADIKKICIKHPDKPRNAPSELFTTDYSDLIYDKEINLIVELIDDPVAAYSIVCAALANKKAVVSANKKMIAENLQHLLNLQQQEGVSFLYEAAVCGSVPVIRHLEEYYDNDMLQGICGIVNGSTNFILTRIMDENKTYEEALQEAQSRGYAESNPNLDVGGFDAANKLTILLLHAYGMLTKPDHLLCRGITSIDTQDTTFAGEKDYKIKLIARAVCLSDNKIAAYVLPQFIHAGSQLYNVKHEYNGLVIESTLADKQFLCGKGAGRYPTSSAVLSDIAALRYGYRYEYRKHFYGRSLSPASEFFLRVYVSFENGNQVSKWDFECIEEYHSTEKRQYLIGIIHCGKLKEAPWFSDPMVSIILMPDAIIEKSNLLQRKIKKLSLQLAGVWG